MKPATTPEEIAARNNLKRIFEQQKYGPEQLTQKALAGKMGLKQQSAISQYLTGRNTIGIEATVKFANALGVEPTDIRPDFFQLLPIRTRAQEHTVRVISTMTGGVPSTRKIVTQIKDKNAVEHFAIEIDNDDYRAARIRRGSYVVVAPEKQAKVADDVYLVLQDGTQYLGIANDLEGDNVCITCLRSNETIVIDKSDIAELGVVVGVQNPD